MRITYHSHSCKVDAPTEAQVEKLRELTVYVPEANNTWAQKKQAKAKGYRHDPRKYLYHKGTKTFPTGLLDRVLAAFPEAVVSGTPTFPGSTPVWTLADPTRQPRYYQLEAFEALHRSKRGVVKMATGTGKSMLAAMLASAADGVVLVTTPNRRLLRQQHKDLKRDLGTPVGILGDKEQDLEPRVVVATIQSLSSRIESQDLVVLGWLSKVTTWICDEAHGAAAASYQNLSRVLINCHERYAVTATWMREDGTQPVMEAVLSERVVYEYSIGQGIADGYLSPVEVVLREHKHPGPYTRAKPNFISYYTEAIVENQARNLGIALDAATLVDEGQTPAIVFTKRKEHAKKLAKLLACPYVDGDAETDDVDAQLLALMNGEFPLLVASGILNVGVDLPALRAGINAAAGDSRITITQQLGRGTRLSPETGKTKFVFIDYIDEERHFFGTHGNGRRFLHKTLFPSSVKSAKFEPVIDGGHTA